MTLENVRSFITEQGCVLATKEELEYTIINQPEILRGRFTHALGTTEIKGGVRCSPVVDNYFKKEMLLDWGPEEQQYLQGTSFLVR